MLTLNFFFSLSWLVLKHSDGVIAQNSTTRLNNSCFSSHESTRTFLRTFLFLRSHNQAHNHIKIYQLYIQVNSTFIQQCKDPRSNYHQAESVLSKHGPPAHSVYSCIYKLNILAARIITVLVGNCLSLRSKVTEPVLLNSTKLSLRAITLLILIYTWCGLLESVTDLWP